MQSLRNLAPYCIGAIIGAVGVAALQSGVVHAQAQPTQAVWAFQVTSTSLPEAWKLNTRTGDLFFCSYNGLTNDKGCARIPEPR